MRGSNLVIYYQIASKPFTTQNPQNFYALKTFIRLISTPISSEALYTSLHSKFSAPCPSYLIPRDKTAEQTMEYDDIVSYDLHISVVFSLDSYIKYNSKKVK